MRLHVLTVFSLPRRILIGLLAIAMLASAPRCDAQKMAEAKAAPPQKTPAAQAKTPAKPAPDVLIFTNGDQLSGQLERVTGSSIVFKSDMAGEITVDAGEVKEMHSSGSFALLRKNVRLRRSTVASVETGTVSLNDSKITLADPAGEAQTVPLADVSYLIDQATYDRDIAKSPGLLTGWNGSMTAGATLVRSTQNNQTFNGAITLVRAIPTVPWLPKVNRTSFDANEDYGKVTQQGTPSVKTSIFHADAERDEYFSPKAFGLVQTAFDHNFSQGLDLAQTYGIGIGWTATQKPLQELDLKVDAHYLKQQFQTPISNQDLIGSMFSETYRRNLPRKMVFNEQISLIPAWNNLAAYAANGSAGLLLPVYKRLSMSVSTIDNFLNEPGVGFKKNSFQFITGVTYTLR
ncbi:MAG: DUF481 domain-containing protein [Acidobacteriaceae bacterium]